MAVVREVVESGLCRRDQSAQLLLSAPKTRRHAATSSQALTRYGPSIASRFTPSSPDLTYCCTVSVRISAFVMYAEKRKLRDFSAAESQTMLDGLAHYIAKLDPQDAESLEVMQLAQSLTAKISRISVRPVPIYSNHPSSFRPAYGFVERLRPTSTRNESVCPLARL